MCAASTEGLQLVPQPKRDHDLFGPELLLSLRQSGCDSPDWREHELLHVGVCRPDERVAFSTTLLLCRETQSCRSERPRFTPITTSHFQIRCIIRGVCLND